MKKGRSIPAEKVAETAGVVASQARMAREMGAARIEAVATAAIRKAVNRDELAVAVERAAGVPLRVLTEEEEARLSFVGATRSLTMPPQDSVAVVDVGGGSTEIAIGTMAGGVDWWASLPIGSGLLSDGYLHSDPPVAQELERARLHAAGAGGPGARGGPRRVCFRGTGPPARRRGGRGRRQRHVAAPPGGRRAAP